MHIAQPWRSPASTTSTSTKECFHPPPVHHGPDGLDACLRRRRQPKPAFIRSTAVLVSRRITVILLLIPSSTLQCNACLPVASLVCKPLLYGCTSNTVLARASLRWLLSSSVASNKCFSLTELLHHLSALAQDPHLSIRIGIWILPSDDFFCICFDHPDRETTMLSVCTSTRQK